MAKLLVQLHWDPKAKEVVKTYRVLRIEPTDKIQFSTDSADFFIKSKNAKLAKQLGIEKAPNTNGRDLYQVKQDEGITLSPRPTVGRIPAWLKLKCGTLDKSGKFISWGGVGPLGP